MTDPQVEELQKIVGNLDNAFWKLISILNDKHVIDGKEELAITEAQEE